MVVVVVVLVVVVVVAVFVVQDDDKLKLKHTGNGWGTSNSPELKATEQRERANLETPDKTTHFTQTVSRHMV